MVRSQHTSVIFFYSAIGYSADAGAITGHFAICPSGMGSDDSYLLGNGIATTRQHRCSLVHRSGDGCHHGGNSGGTCLCLCAGDLSGRAFASSITAISSLATGHHYSIAGFSGAFHRAFQCPCAFQLDELDDSLQQHAGLAFGLCRIKENTP